MLSEYSYSKALRAMRTVVQSLRQITVGGEESVDLNSDRVEIDGKPMEI